MRSNKQAGFTLIELLIVVAIISIIAAIAVPGLLRARMTGNETSAIGSLSAIRSGQVSYSSSCGNNAYATLLTILGKPAPGTTAGFISADLAGSDKPTKSGYTFEIGVGTAAVLVGVTDCNAKPVAGGYLATAVPQTLGTSGGRAFATDAGNTIWQDTTGIAPAQPFAVSATVTPIQ